MTPERRRRCLALVVLTEVRVSVSEWLSQRHAIGMVGVHFCESLASTVIGEFSRPGDTVLDPFAGYGTSLLVAERMGRRAVGIELLAERARVIRHRAGAEVIVHVGDVRAKLEDVASGVQLCFTSPPYMTATEHAENPLTGYATLDGDYRTYLDELARIFARVALLLGDGGRVVLNVADQGPPDAPTPLVTDIGTALERSLILEQTIPVVWDTSPVGLFNDTLLVFRSRSVTNDASARPALL